MRADSKRRAAKRALIEHVNTDGSMRVRPLVGQRSVITGADTATR